MESWRIVVERWILIIPAWIIDVLQAYQRPVPATQGDSQPQGWASWA